MSTFPAPTAPLLVAAEIQQGLSLQLVDLRTHEPQSHSAEVAPSMGLSFLLEGRTDIRFARQDYRLGAIRRGLRPSVPQMTLFRSSQAVEFSRRLDPDMRLRHLSIQATPDWLERSGLADYSAAAPLLQGDGPLVLAPWTPSEQLVSLTEQLLRPPVGGAPADALARLQRESQVLEIMVQSLASLGSVPRSGGADTRTLRQLHRLRERLESDSTQSLSVEGLAREFGMSADTLQRQFRAVFGTTVFGHLQEHRMQRARQAIERGSPVSSAAYAAGYTSPANFSTAFKRRFGIAPKQVRRRYQA